MRVLHNTLRNITNEYMGSQSVLFVPTLEIEQFLNRVYGDGLLSRRISHSSSVEGSLQEVSKNSTLPLVNP